MWLVKVALNRPYTFIVFALLILILSVLLIKALGGGWDAFMLPPIGSLH